MDDRTTATLVLLREVIEADADPEMRRPKTVSFRQLVRRLEAGQ
jgi:hypothetical protein